MPRGPPGNRDEGGTEVGKRSGLVGKQERSQEARGLAPAAAFRAPDEESSRGSLGAAGEPVIVFGFHQDELQMIFQGLISQHICSI